MAMVFRLVGVVLATGIHDVRYTTTGLKVGAGPIFAIVSCCHATIYVEVREFRLKLNEC